jgi:hypothetical protein
MKYHVKNLQEGSKPTPSGYTSWIDYWERKTGKKAVKCHKTGCNELATDGAHVQLENGGNEWYIVPLCHKCNMQRGQSFMVEGPLVPVSSDVSIR